MCYTRDMTVIERDPPTEEDAALAREGSRALARLLREAGDSSAGARLSVGAPGGDSVELSVSERTLRLLRDVLEETARGNAVAVVSVAAELTPREAAEALGVSRSFLLTLMDSGKLPYRRVGAHRRIRLSDALALWREAERRASVMDALAGETDALGLSGEV